MKRVGVVCGAYYVVEKLCSVGRGHVSGSPKNVYDVEKQDLELLVHLLPQQTKRCFGRPRRHDEADCNVGDDDIHLDVRGGLYTAP